MVQLGGFGERRPAQLSGGQQQRVAVARALVFEPKLVLMDEPLGALDKQLREQMQLEIRRLHQRLGVTMVYVTHDQGEALTMSDRIAVFHRGRIQQLDTPGAIYEEPGERVRRAVHRREQPARRQSSKRSTAAAARSALAVATRARRVRCAGAARARRRRHRLAAPGAGANRSPGIQGRSRTARSRARCAR